MKGNARFALILAAVYAVLGGVAALLCLLLWADLGTTEKQALAAIFDHRLPLTVFILLMLLAGLGVLIHILYRHHIHTPRQMNEQLGAMLDASHDARLPEEGPEQLCRLAQAINRLADQREALRADVAQKIREAVAGVEEERNRFSTLIAELSQSVIVCNADGRILLYNASARALFSREAAGTTPIGIGRSVFGVLERSLITHSLDKIRQGRRAGAEHTLASFVTTSPGGQLIRAQMAPVLHGTGGHNESGVPKPGGYVLILEDITHRTDLESRRDMLLQSLTEGGRASLANIRAAVENLSEYTDMNAQQRNRFISVVHEEAQTMSKRLERTLSEFSDAIKMHWPLEDMLGLDLIQAAQSRIEQRLGLPSKTEELEANLWLKVDSYSLLQGMTYLAARLQDEFRIREVHFRLGRSGRLAYVDVIWSGAVIGTETLMNWELEPMNLGGEATPISLREVIERHDGEIWVQREKLTHRSCFRLLLPTSEAPQPAGIL